MQLTWPVFAAVLFAAFLHASWNAMVKSSADKGTDMALIHLAGSVLAIPLVMWAGIPSPAAWPYLATSLLVHVAYYIALTGAYKHGDLGLTYPLMRGTAPLLVALSATFTVGEHLSAVSWLGVMAICCGVLLLGLSKQALNSPKAIQFALANAVIIAIYTVVDAMGVRASGNALQYVFFLFLIDGWLFAALMLWRRRSAMLDYAKGRWPLTIVGAAASLSSYGIALWAMTQAPMATVAALRETSVLFAALIGFWVLKEKFSRQRLLGTFTILAGMVALRIAR
jgi:phosphonate utilization associated putative membrane protein